MDRGQGSIWILSWLSLAFSVAVSPLFLFTDRCGQKSAPDLPRVRKKTRLCEVLLVLLGRPMRFLVGECNSRKKTREYNMNGLIWTLVTLRWRLQLWHGQWHCHAESCRPLASRVQKHPIFFWLVDCTVYICLFSRWTFVAWLRFTTELTQVVSDGQRCFFSILYLGT